MAAEYISHVNEFQEIPGEKSEQKKDKRVSNRGNVQLNKSNSKTSFLMPFLNHRQQKFLERFLKMLTNYEDQYQNPNKFQPELQENFSVFLE